MLIVGETVCVCVCVCVCASAYVGYVPMGTLYLLLNFSVNIELLQKISLLIKMKHHKHIPVPFIHMQIFWSHFKM